MEQTAETQALSECREKLIIGFSCNPLGTATALLGKGLIDGETESRMQISSLTPREKATALVQDLIRHFRMKPTPEKFQEFIGVLKQNFSNKDLVKILEDKYQGNNHSL